MWGGGRRPAPPMTAFTFAAALAAAAGPPPPPPRPVEEDDGHGAVAPAMAWPERYMRLAVLVVAAFLLLGVHSAAVEDADGGAPPGRAAFFARHHDHAAAAAPPLLRGSEEAHHHVPGMRHQTALVMPPTEVEARDASRQLEEMRVAHDVLADLQVVPAAAAANGRAVVAGAWAVAGAARAAAAAAGTLRDVTPCSRLVMAVPADAATTAVAAAARAARRPAERLDIIVGVPVGAAAPASTAVLARYSVTSVPVRVAAGPLASLAAALAIIDDPAACFVVQTDNAATAAALEAGELQLPALAAWAAVYSGAALTRQGVVAGCLTSPATVPFVCTSPAAPWLRVLPESHQECSTAHRGSSDDACFLRVSAHRAVPVDVPLLSVGGSVVLLRRSALPPAFPAFLAALAEASPPPPDIGAGAGAALGVDDALTLVSRTRAAYAARAAPGAAPATWTPPRAQDGAAAAMLHACPDMVLAAVVAAGGVPLFAVPLGADAAPPVAADLVQDAVRYRANHHAHGEARPVWSRGPPAAATTTAAAATDAADDGVTRLLRSPACLAAFAYFQAQGVW